MRTLNLGILAHVDAGKTTLTERLLYAAGAIDTIGSVDAGTTQTDFLALERERGITIRSAVASFKLDDLAVNLIDTPGHPDFIAEVERALSVLDAAVLVVSAVEGVQPQTPLLMRALRRQRVPTLVFVNKIDRAGADSHRVVADLVRRLELRPIALGAVADEGTRSARYVPADTRPARAALAAALADSDEELLATLVETDEIPDIGALRQILVRQVARLEVHPVIFGSALMGVGVDAVMEAIATVLPAADGDPDAPLSARVFKIERSADGARTALARLYAGRLSVREFVSHGSSEPARVTHLSVYDTGGPRPAATIEAGQIGAISGLEVVRVGDYLGVRPQHVAVEQRFPPPTLEAVVAPLVKSDAARMRSALAQLAEQDPLINVRQDDADQISVSLYGEVQREVIEATLERDYGVRASFRQTSVVHIERPAARGEAEQVIAAATHSNISGRSSPHSQNPYRATLALYIEPAPAGSGVEVVVDVDVHLVPLYIYHTVAEFSAALTEYVHAVLRDGLYGWEVTDCRVTVWDSGYARTGSTSRDFRLLTGLVLRSALESAGTVVCEPMTVMRLQIPAAATGGVGALLGQSGARVTGQFTAGDTASMVATIPTAQVGEMKRRLSGASSGEGVMETDFGGFAPVSGPPPVRHARSVARARG